MPHDAAPAFVLLDDCHATPVAPSSRLYTGLVRSHVCHDPASLESLWQAVQADLASGLHAAVFIDYEWGTLLQQAGTQHAHAAGAALRVLMFEHLVHYSQAEVETWLHQQDAESKGHQAPPSLDAQPSVAGLTQLHSGVDRAAFDAAVEAIHSHIRAGETYQINYTYRLEGQQFGSPLALYRRLRALQPVGFGALAYLPHSAADQPQWVLSRSPELFLRHHNGQLTARPMKGTAARSPDAAQDAAIAHWLASDPKNVAENVMIVDLLRNDLARVSETGSVRVAHLLKVETYRTVHQMTSTVQSALRPSVGFPEILRALFPCGSITGAPKIQSMKLIGQLESTPRGLYCGSIGWLDAPAANSPHATGNFCLNVAIRTLTLGAPSQGLRPVRLGVGGGIVIDSTAAHEFAETQVKARFVETLDPGFTLFETLRCQGGRVLRWPLHLQRLRHSAQALGFTLNLAALEQALRACLTSLDPQQVYRVRLDVHKDGSCFTQHAVLPPLPAGPLRLLLTQQRLSDAERALLPHKTSVRHSYDQAIQWAVEHGAFDAVFLNDQGEVTEGGRSTLWCCIGGLWYTPPLSCGVLAGTLRTRLLRFAPLFSQRVLDVQTFRNASAWMVSNALRGLQPAQLIAPSNTI